MTHSPFPWSAEDDTENPVTVLDADSTGVCVVYMDPERKIGMADLKLVLGIEKMAVALVAAEHALAEGNTNCGGSDNIYADPLRRVKEALEASGVDTKAVWSKYKLGEPS